MRQIKNFHQRILIVTFAAILTVGVLALGTQPVLARELPVSSASEITTALKSAQPGDVLVLADGTYRDQQIVFNGKGVENNPITLRAATPGKATFTGKSSLVVTGSWLVVDGLRFEETTLAPIELRDASHSQVTNCAVIRCNPEDNTRFHWIRIAGSGSHHNRIDHCYTKGKTKDGVVLVIDGDTKTGEMNADNRIDHNYFKDVTRAVRNGMETIRIGTSPFGQKDARATVEYNLFENCSGDAEIISNKSCGNIYRYNTFINSEGAVVMRHGHRSRVEDNFFFGENNARAGGVRVHGSDHVVINNYFSNLGRFSLAFPAGQGEFVAAGWEPTLNCFVAYNTIVEPAGPAIVIGEDPAGAARKDAPELKKRNIPPTNLRLFNNLISGEWRDGIKPIQQSFDGTPQPIQWQGNILFLSGKAKTELPTIEGVRLTDPKLQRGADTLWRPTGESAALQAAVPTPVAVPTDMDGQPRPNPSTIGADHVSTAPILSHPLSAKDLGREIGPAWMH